jgi:hypothetical protein
MANYLDPYKKIAKENEDPITAMKKQAITDSATASKQQIQEDYTADVQATRDDYKSLLDDANINRLVSERRIKENLANMGASDSGLAEHQMTALQVAQGNAQAKALRQRQAKLDALARTMRAQTTSIDQEAKSKLADIDITAQENINKNAQSMYQAEVDAINSAAKTANETAAAKIKARNELVDKLIKTKENGERIITDQGVINALMKSYFDQYGADDTDYDVFKNLGQDIDGYYGYYNAQNSAQRINDFKSSLTPISQMQFSRSGVPGAPKDSSLYSSYKEYVNETLERWIREGKLSETDVAKIVALYGLEDI